MNIESEKAMAEPSSGTWTIDGELDGSAYSLHTSPLYQAAVYADNAVIADVRLSDYTDKRTPEEARANARLIAAAPDLLAACEAAAQSLAADEEILIDWDPNGFDAQLLAQLRAAIAKARPDQP